MFRYSGNPIACGPIGSEALLQQDTPAVPPWRASQLPPYLRRGASAVVTPYASPGLLCAEDGVAGVFAHRASGDSPGRTGWPPCRNAGDYRSAARGWRHRGSLLHVCGRYADRHGHSVGAGLADALRRGELRGG